MCQKLPAPENTTAYKTGSLFSGILNVLRSITLQEFLKQQEVQEVEGQEEKDPI